MATLLQNYLSPTQVDMYGERFEVLNNVECSGYGCGLYMVSCGPQGVAKHVTGCTGVFHKIKI
jgi:hypothetical protein